MRWLRGQLRGAGFDARTVAYPSRRLSVREAVERRLLPLVCRDGLVPMHFVTHSLGGILARYLWKCHPQSNFRRMVMLAPPNQGNEIIDWIRRGPWGEWILGPIVQELGTAPSDTARRLGPVAGEVGVIMGNRPLIPFFQGLLPGENDGIVTVERGRIEGMADFLVLPHDHTFLMRRRRLAEQTIHFLRHGRFDRRR